MSPPPLHASQPTKSTASCFRHVAAMAAMAARIQPSTSVVVANASLADGRPAGHEEHRATAAS